MEIDKNCLHSIQFKPIGYVFSCYIDKFGTPRQSGLVSQAEGWVELLPHVQPEFSLEGLAEFSHLWVVFLFHKNNNSRFHAKVHPPRLDGESKGLFATRTPHRPNPVGLSLVEIIRIENNRIHVRGLDLIDETPIIDIKPYLPCTESVPHARSGWVEKSEKQNLQIQWTVASEEFIRRSHPQPDQVKALIENSLRLDPRPKIYKGYEGKESKYRQSHRMRIYDFDIQFKFTSECEVQIEGVRNYSAT